jgi:hypothetical protein
MIYIVRVGLSGSGLANTVIFQEQQHIWVWAYLHQNELWWFLENKWLFHLVSLSIILYPVDNKAYFLWEIAP